MAVTSGILCQTQCPAWESRGDVSSCPNTPLVGVSGGLQNETPFALESGSGDTSFAGGQELGAVPVMSGDAGDPKRAGLHRATSLL